MKRNIYIALSVVLGVLFSFLVHGIVEIWVIKILYRRGPGVNWDTWFMVHHVGSVVLFLGGIISGYLLGKKWWNMVYVEGRHWRKKK